MSPSDSCAHRVLVPHHRSCLAVLLCALVLTACAPPEHEPFAVQDFSQTAKRPQSCANHNPERNAYFGDLHVHTAFSSDAYTQEVRATPDDAYRFAFQVKNDHTANSATAGSPHNSRIAPVLKGALKRPLDFMAVTDHAEFLGETRLCHRGNTSAKWCKVLGEGNPHSLYMLKYIMLPLVWRESELCGEDNHACQSALDDAWQDTIRAAEHWNDTSDACERVTFVGFEYSSHRLGSNLHRNVVFRNAHVTRRPISYIDTTREWHLWDILNRQCVEGHPECDAMSIPHNSNISNGRMFAVDYPNTWLKSQQRERAQLRAKMEPLVEIMQHKGDSECRNGIADVGGSEDELCAFEKPEELRWKQSSDGPDVSYNPCYTGPLADWVPHLGPDCLSSLSYARYALIEGLKEEQRLGVNPYKFGLSAGTDTHNAVGGTVAEYDFRGHLGILDNTTPKRLNRLAGAASVGDNPGGLIGVWSVQNTRDDLFTAMKKREVFGTSGPRIRPRFFGGWDYKDGLCDEANWLRLAYNAGTPMGGDLPKAPNGKSAPVFVVQALADTGTEEQAGTPLQHLQVIKGWVDDSGKKQQRVYTVRSQTDIPRLDVNQCTRDTGRSRVVSNMCQVWHDPEFDPQQRAVYYARVVEAPTCRYTQHQCLNMPAGQSAAICAADDVTVPKTIQERAWTSPIWYTPPN